MRVAVKQVDTLVRPWIIGGSQLRYTAGDNPRNPFTDSRVISSLASIAVSDLDRVKMSTYQAEDTEGWL